MKRTPLKRIIPLLPGKAVLRVSLKAIKEGEIWRKVKEARIDKLKERYDYLPCEWCKVAISHGMTPEGHHNDRNRRHNTLGNCRIVHSGCHRYVTDHNVRDVPDLLAAVRQGPAGK